MDGLARVAFAGGRLPLSAVCLLDTSIFCEILAVPNMHADAAGHIRKLRARVEAGETLLLPMTAILETGNHIGHHGAGAARRAAAERFVEQVTRAVNGSAPFEPSRFWTPEVLVEWLAAFPNWAARVDPKGKGSGLGDLSLVEEWKFACELFPRPRVYIWSLDAHLSSYDRAV